jgi:Uma2 family endonuclease
METTSTKRLTYAYLLSLPEDNKRRELIDGKLYVTPSATPLHQLVLGNLHIDLRGFVDAHDLGRVYFAPLDIVLSDINVVEPDLLFVSRARLAIIDERCLRAAPDLAVEVLSPSTRRIDAGRKRQLYATFGVAEYWMIDPKREWVQVCRNDGGELQEVTQLVRERGDGPLTSPLFPGFALPLDRLFR